MKIVDYKSTAAWQTDDLTISVNNLISEGYQPWGSMNCSRDSDNDLIFSQAMVKYEPGIPEHLETVISNADR